MDLTDYAITPDGFLAYVPRFGNDNSKRYYRVWGIGKNGLIHGTGAYLNRQRYIDDGYDFFIIDVPTYQEIEKYYDNLNKLFGDGK